MPAALRLPISWLAPLLTQTAEMGALPSLRAATDPAVRGYPKLVTSSRDSHDHAAQPRLWTVSEELTGLTFPVQ